MARRNPVPGRNLSQIFENAPSDFLREFLASCKTPDGDLLDPPDLETTAAGDTPNENLREFVDVLDPDVLGELDRLSSSVLELSEGKGITSLETVAANRLYNVDHDLFSEVPDPLCRSIWVHCRFPEVFQDAESFYAARRYRDHRKLYAAFEVDHDDLVELDRLTPDTDRLCRKLEELLELRAKATASVLELPQTTAHPPSLMVALRHPGALSSIRDHREDGNLKTYYYRPSHEAVLIYTPAQRKIEVCAESFSVRQQVANAFAEIALSQDLSAKPLTKRDFNLTRFRTSFDLELPDLDEAEITSATVVEAEMPLGNWARRLNLKVTRDEDIENAMTAYVRDASQMVRKFGFAKIVIAVGFVRRSDGKKATLRLQVSGGNTSNVQSQRDPFLRDLGFKLLAHWGLMDELHPLTDEEKARWFQFLLSLYDLPDDVVSGNFFSAAGVDPRRLMQSGFLTRKPRQVLVLIDDDDDGTAEGELQTGPRKGTLTEQGGFGEDRGVITDTNAISYGIDRRWLAEEILKLLGAALGVKSIEIETNHLTRLGAVHLKKGSVPVYLVRDLGNTKVLDALDIALRQKHKLGPGIVLAVSESAPKYLGPNVVVKLPTVLSRDGSDIEINWHEFQRQFDAGRTLIAASQLAQVIRHGANAGTLVLPGTDPLSLTSAIQLRFFEKLVTAAADGSGEVLTKVLMDGTGSDHPKNLFSPKMRDIVTGTYICHGSSNRYWRLRSGLRDLITDMED
ncbi:hypothetical protein LCL97_11490 [Seohaeicola saemankumensis]|nr:hypothetical protein [Seohaeicola saemankumensis]MCA0871452.1 hypothetical protein [Seohaeicola saemankumensis]